MEVSGQVQAPGASFPWNVPGNHCIEECVGPRACLDAVSKTNSFPALPGN